jgi:protein-S-isoprenylcysteine O-methyltransferase Ste14
MGATALEFRLRMVINTAIIVLGVWAPWVPRAERVYVLEWLPRELAHLGWMPFSTAVNGVLIVSAVLAAMGAILRVWGSAWLGPATVTHLDMQAGSVMASGPYRYMRNPLYVGLWCMVAAIALLMPRSGAVVAIILLSVFLVRLTLGEEAFLLARLGEPYRAYLRAVPRFFPRLRSGPPPSAVRPQWVRAVLSELTPIAVFVAIVVFARNFDEKLMARIILIGLGTSLVVRAFLPRAEAETKQPV